VPASPLQWASHATLILVVLYALWAGGAPERLTACAVTLAYVASPYAQLFTSLVEPQYGVLLVDAALLLVLLVLSLVSDRRWLLFATAAHGLGVLTHLAVVADPALLPRAYLSANIATAYLVLGTLAFGAWSRRRIVNGAHLYSR
jgi:hypothetical protein